MKHKLDELNDSLDHADGCFGALSQLNIEKEIEINKERQAQMRFCCEPKIPQIYIFEM